MHLQYLEIGNIVLFILRTVRNDNDHLVGRVFTHLVRVIQQYLADQGGDRPYAPTSLH